MPTYEYRCTSCEHEFVTRQKMTDEPLTVCPHCEKETLKKIINPTGFILKGEGWYVTDFKGRGKGGPDD